MSKWLNKAAALSLCGALALVACSRDSPVVSTGRGGEKGVAIPDAKLHAAIASALGKASNALITADEMATLTRLDAPNSGIRDLTGLEFATSLTRLNLGIDKVEGRYVNSNDISDLTPLAGLANLTWLTLTNTGVSDLTPLAGLTNLTRLSLGRNSVADLTPLAGLTNLTELWLWNNNLSDLTPLAGLTSLTQLILSNTGVSDLTPLAGLTNLTELSLGDNSVADLTPLAGLTSLTSLSLGDNSVADLTPLAGLTSLTWLSLYNNSVSDLTPLTGLIHLTGLQLDSNSISDLTPLADLTSLTGLSLYNNSISDLTPLAGLTSLIWLRLDSNSISDLTPLAGLTNLIRLYLNANSISDLTPLVGLTNLATLWLGDNSIADLTPLAELTNLTELRLENNNISDIAPLVENTGLGIGNWIDVQGNPLSDASINTHIPALQARGVISDGDGEETPVAIPDAKLHAAIANELGKASNAPTTASEMATLSHLFALDSDILELTGLEYAINLTTLQLYNNRVSDLTPLAGLTNLIRLHLRLNSMSDLTPFAGLTNLTTLYLYNNNVSDLTPLAGLTNLTTLELSFNAVSDLTPLAGLTNLTTLELGRNSIADLTPLAGLTNLTALQLYNSFVSDLTPLAGLTNLTELHLYGNRISNSDLTHLAGLTNLTALQLGFNGVSDLTPLAGLTNLTELEIEDNAITDLTPLAGLTNLITLELGNNEISELPVGVFAGFANLETLSLSRNPGAPFAFTLELERTDAANRLAPSPADVAVQLAEGAPFDITVALSVHNGSASVASLTIGAGDTASTPAHVTAIGGSSTATHVVLDHAPQIPSGFTGIEVRTGNPLVLFAESDDHFPVAEGEIPPHILQVGGPKPTLDVTEYFSDADGDELVYSVSSNDDHLVGTRVNAGLLTLIPRAEGYTSLVVTATDSNGWSAAQDLAVTVLPTPDPRSFDIDLVFVGPVTADTRSAALQAAKRWTEVITGDLPDVPVPDNSVLCLPVEQRFFGTIDDLVVFVAVESLTGASGHGGLCNWRADSSLPYMGYSVLDTELVARGREYVAGVTLHEIGHALGFGPLWHDFGFLQDSGGADPHFNGPLAIEAFDAAGGTNYTAGAKVPVSAGGGHWRFGGELMGVGGSALSAITVQSLADLGYVVDVSQADPFQLPSTAKAIADQGLDLRDDILQGPIRVADENGHIVRVIHP